LDAKRELLWVADVPAPPNVIRATRDRWMLRACRRDRRLREQVGAAPLALVYLNGAANDLPALGQVVAELAHSAAVGVFLLPREAEAAWGRLIGRGGPFVCLRDDAPPEELAARLACCADLQPALRALRSEADAARTAFRLPPDAAQELTEEMRLAARLQRDFLPRRLPEVGGVRFGVLFRPASWVSGDIYDVVRLDETHLGFYIADAVGHGLPAALLTMFVKRGLQTKRIFQDTYEIVAPHTALEELNADICRQELSSCQFCTAVYCVLDVAERTLTCARAGHPEPLIIHADRRVETVQGGGPLLGIFPEEQYPRAAVRLGEGDRVMLYSDGAETALFGPGGAAAGTPDRLAEWAGAPRDDVIEDLSRRIDAARQSGQLDDATVVIADVAG
jgi:hypothetical protein